MPNILDIGSPTENLSPDLIIVPLGNISHLVKRLLILYHYSPSPSFSILVTSGNLKVGVTSDICVAVFYL
nr:MAG TPA: hypothetical protein [Bacteriophage sp.]